MIIILGLDGLDPYLLDKFELNHLKQNWHTRLKVPEDVPLHTEVIWPTIITGVKPDKHALTRTNARKWKNPLLQAFARVAVVLLPSKLLLSIGKKIQILGFKRVGRGNPEYYNRKGLETIFSGTRAKVVGVPGYKPAEKTDQLRRLGGHSTHEPLVEIDELIKELENEFKDRERAILEGLELPVNLLMVYVFSTDMIGHLFWDDRDFLESWYSKCDDVVRRIQEKMSSSDKLIVLSDHGMKDGKHRREAFFSCSESVNPKPSSILDIKPLVNKMLADIKEGHNEVKNRLQDLGYI